MRNQHSLCQRIGLVLGTIGTMIACADVRGQTNYDWINTSNNFSFYDVGTNWNPNGPPTALDTARFSQAATYEVWWDNLTGSQTVQRLDVFSGDVTFLNLDPNTQWDFNIASGGGAGIIGNNTSLTIKGLHLNSQNFLGTGNQGTLVIDGSPVTGSQLTASNGLFVDGMFSVINGGIATTSVAELGSPVENGTATITGAGSTWNNLGELFVSGSSSRVNVIEGGVVTSNATTIQTGQVWVNNPNSQMDAGTLTLGITGNALMQVVGGSEVASQTTTLGAAFNVAADLNVWDNGTTMTTGSLTIGGVGHGHVNVETGGYLTSSSSTIASGFASNSTMVVANAQWDNTNELQVGVGGTGAIEIFAGGIVNSGSTRLGILQGSNGSINFLGEGASLAIAGDLAVGEAGTGNLDISFGGHVTVSGTTSIGSAGTVLLSSGRFEFGSTSYPEFARIQATGGSLAGDVYLSGYNQTSALVPLQNTVADLSDVRVLNSGVMEGGGMIRAGIDNLVSGEIRTYANQQVRFGGIGNINQGEINNYGGSVEFEQDLTNEAGGFISGRGQFMAQAGWTNRGVVAISAGIADIVGDFDNQAGGQVVTSGHAVTTFYDDVIHNGAEIRTSEGSSTVFFGNLSGAGPFTGTGDVFIEGDLRPGNSPDIVSFAGDLFLGSSSELLIELAGTDLGYFDQLDIAGNLDIAGALDVSLINGFELRANQEFLIADIDGLVTGTLMGLGEGSLVGNYGGRDLYISYSRGSGNDIALFTAIPEPGPSYLLGMAGLGLLSGSRRRKQGVNQHTFRGT